MNDPQSDLEALVQSAQDAFAAAGTPADLENAKARFLGKSGSLTDLLKGMAAGDIKLMGVIGLYSGAALTLDIALLTALIGGLWVISLFQWQIHADPRRIRQLGICLRHRGLRAGTQAKVAAHNKSLLIPYGAVITTGTILALLIASH